MRKKVEKKKEKYLTRCQLPNYRLQPMKLASSFVRSFFRGAKSIAQS